MQHSPIPKLCQNLSMIHVYLQPAQLLFIRCHKFDILLNLSTAHWCTLCLLLFPSFSLSAYLLYILVYVLHHGYRATEQFCASSVLWCNIHRAHINVHFNACVATNSWCLINAIKNGKVNINKSLLAGDKALLPDGKHKSLNS